MVSRAGRRRADKAAWRRWGWMLGAAYLVLVLASCQRSSDEEQLLQAVDAMEVAIEAGETGDFMQHLAEDFTANDGELDRTGMQRLLMAQALANTHIGVVRTGTDIQVTDQRANVQITLLVEGGSGRWLPERGSSFEISSGWRLRDGEWKCVNAQWVRQL